MEGPHALGESPSDGRARAAEDGGSRRADWERGAPAVAEKVRGLRGAVVARAGAAGATERTRADLAVAVSEALSNVVRHAYRDRAAPGPMHVALGIEGPSLVVVVSDEGAGIRPRVGSEGAGLGLAMISALASELTLTAGTNASGTRVAMRFPLDS